MPWPIQDRAKDMEKEKQTGASKTKHEQKQTDKKDK